MLMRWAATSLAIGFMAPQLGAQSAARTPCESVQYGFVDSTASSRSRRFQDPRTGGSFALKDTTVLTSAIERVTVWPHRIGRDTAWDVIAKFTASAADTLASVTGTHVGQIIAIRIGDDIVETAIINSSLRSTIAFAVDASKATADSVAARVKRATAESCRSR
jgi:hypothetical protein